MTDPSPTRPPAPLTPAQRRALRARAHSLKPVVMVGAAGVSEAVRAELDGALEHHELVKVRFLGAERAAIEQASQALCQQLGAVNVQRIGRILVLFRPRPPQPAPAAAKKAQRRRR